MNDALAPVELLAGQCGVADRSVFMEKIVAVHRLLLVANAAVNLTRITEFGEFMTKHVADSLLLGLAFPDLRTRPLTVGDIGTGAGFPALVLALAYPEWRVFAMDSVGKKTAFVESVAEGLAIANLTVVTGRTPELNRQRSWQGRFDVLTARAVGPAAKIRTEAARMLKPKGQFILYKTPEQAAEEVAGLPGWKVTEAMELPDGAGRRCFMHGG